MPTNFWEIFIEAYMFYVIYYWADFLSDTLHISPPSDLETKPNNQIDHGGKILPTATVKRIEYGIALIVVFVLLYAFTKKKGW